MPYDPITKISQLDPTKPAGTEPVSNLDDAIRQLAGFLQTFLAVSHDDDGGLLSGSVTESAVGSGSIPPSALMPGIDGGKLLSYSVDDPQIADNAIKQRHIVDGAVGENQLAALAVTAAKLALLAVEEANLAANAVTTTKIADLAVTAAKIASVDGGKLQAGTVEAAAHEVDADIVSAAQPGLVVLNPSGAANNAAAVVGGVLTATLNTGTTPPTLTFAFAGSGPTDTAGVALFEQTASGDTALSWTSRTNTWTRRFGDSVASESGSGITVSLAGTYLVFFGGMGYSCDGHQTRLMVGASDRAYGNVAFAAAGAQTMSEGCAVLALNAGDVITLQTLADVVKTSNGQGYTPTGMTTNVGYVRLISAN